MRNFKVLKMKLKFFIDSKKKKVYTLQQEKENKKTHDAHYKFLKFQDKSEQKDNSQESD